MAAETHMDSPQKAHHRRNASADSDNHIDTASAQQPPHASESSNSQTRLPLTRHDNRTSTPSSISLLSSLWTHPTSTLTSPDPTSASLSLNSTTAAQRASALSQLAGTDTSTALLTRLRQHRPAKSTSSHTTLSSQPVIVRTYSGPGSRGSQYHTRNRSSISTFNMAQGRGHNASHDASAKLPTIDEFTFDGILRAVEPEIHSAIDAIAEICARSRLSLADEYSAHLPPTGEIMGQGHVHERGRPGAPGSRPSSTASSTASSSSWAWPASRLGFAGSSASRTSHGHSRYGSEPQHLAAVPEASSSSERLAGESRAASQDGSKSLKAKPTAVGSLRSIMSGRSKNSRGKRSELPSPWKDGKETGPVSDSASPEDGPSSPSSARRPRTAGWAVLEDSQHSEIALVRRASASNALSLDTTDSATVAEPLTPMEPLHSIQDTEVTSEEFKSRPQLRPRAKTVTLGSWLPWSRSGSSQASSSTLVGETAERTSAEARLKDLLRASAGGADDKHSTGMG